MSLQRDICLGMGVLALARVADAAYPRESLPLPWWVYALIAITAFTCLIAMDVKGGAGGGA